MVAQLCDESSRSSAVHQVWLPPLPAKLTLDAVAPTASDPESPALGACLGLADLPETQRQEPMVVDLSSSGGHLALVGAPQSGKSTALRTLLMSLLSTHTPDQLRAYLLDFGGGTLRGLAAAPHIGDVAGKGDLERTTGTVRHIRNLLTERERRYRELGIESIAEARARALELGPDLASDVLLVIDDWGALMRDHEAVLDDIIEVASSGLHHGVHLIVTSSRWGEIRPNLRDAFGTRIETHLNDPLESDFHKKIADMIAPGLPGRAVTSTGRLFQVALPRLDGVADTDGLTAAVSAFATTLNDRWSGSRPSPIGVLPELVGLGELTADGTRGASDRTSHNGSSGALSSSAVIGLAEMTLAPVALDLGKLDPHVLVLGEPEAGRTEALRTIAHAVSARYGDSAQLIVLDLRRQLEDLTALALDCVYVSRPPQIGEALRELHEVCAQRINGDPAGGDPREPIIVLIDDYDLISGAAASALAPLGDIVFQGRDSGIFVVLATNAGNGARLQTDQVTGRMLESGATALILSGDPHEGPLVRGVRARPLPAGRAQMLRRRDTPVLVQLALSAHPSTAGVMQAVEKQT
jgi:S-DNA-T family DNA segregation ATPase FtsK/SpoIIIE